MKPRKTKRQAAPHKPRPFLLAHERQSWTERLRRLLLLLARTFKAEPGVHLANHDTVRRALLGMGPDSSSARPEAAACMAVNLSSAHVPSFCDDGYKNTYDLQATRAPDVRRISDRRLRVDQALPLGPGGSPSQVYFGAVELAGAGMRYYGDICLVLKPAAVPADTVVLERNSFDVDRLPVLDRIRSLHGESAQHNARAQLLSSWSGRWVRDLPAMATIRMHMSGQTTARRWTTGHVAQAIVSDEDYLEVLKQGTFRAQDIQEARLFVADAALDAYIDSRTGSASPPRFEELIWHRRRLHAEIALRKAGIPVRVVTHVGRMRS